MSKDALPIENRDQSAVSILAALANLDRKEIIDHLADRRLNNLAGMSITELAVRLGVTRFRASHHLNILCEAGIVTATRRGTRTINELSTASLLPLWDWLTHVTDEPAA